MDEFKRHIQGFRKRGGRRGMAHTGGRGGPCSCCVEADKRRRMRLARRRLRDDDRQDMANASNELSDDAEFSVQDISGLCMNGNTRSQE